MNSSWTITKLENEEYSFLDFHWLWGYILGVVWVRLFNLILYVPG